MKILHVTDCLNGGTLTAVSKIISSNPHHEHLLLWDVHGDSPSPSAIEINQITNTDFDWSGNLLRKIRMLRKLVKDNRPDVIHLHSSRAGLLGRTFISRCQVAYSPHGFGFMRSDLPPYIRKGIYVIEKILAFRTNSYIANWPIDIKHMKALNKNVSIRFVPLIDLDFCNYKYTPSTAVPRKILGIGRMTVAKGVEEFTELSTNSYFSENSNSKFIWVGTFNELRHREDSQPNLEFIEWLPRENLQELIHSSLVLIISSKWESGPLTFYESLRLGIPSIVRDIEAFYWLENFKYDSVESAIEILKSLLSSESYRRSMFDSQVDQIEKTFIKFLGEYPGYY